MKVNENLSKRRSKRNSTSINVNEALTHEEIIEMNQGRKPGDTAIGGVDKKEFKDIFILSISKTSLKLFDRGSKTINDYGGVVPPYVKDTKFFGNELDVLKKLI